MKKVVKVVVGLLIVLVVLFGLFYRFVISPNLELTAEDAANIPSREFNEEGLPMRTSGGETDFKSPF